MTEMIFPCVNKRCNSTSFKLVVNFETQSLDVTCRRCGYIWFSNEELTPEIFAMCERDSIESELRTLERQKN